MQIVLALLPTQLVWRELAGVSLGSVDPLVPQLVARVILSVPPMPIALWQQTELPLTAIANQDSQGRNVAILLPPLAILKLVPEKFTLLATTREDVFVPLDSMEIPATQIRPRQLVISPSPSLALHQLLDHSLQLK